MGSWTAYKACRLLSFRSFFSGIERKLKRPRDFQKSIGKFVEVSLFKAFEGKKKYRGVLVNFDEASNEIEILVDEERLLTIAKDERSKVSLFYEFWF